MCCRLQPARPLVLVLFVLYVRMSDWEHHRRWFVKVIIISSCTVTGACNIKTGENRLSFIIVYYCIVCILYQHIFWIFLFCVIITFSPLFIVSLSMILFVTIVIKNIYSTNNFRITSKNEFFSFEKFTSYGAAFVGQA